MMNEHARHNSAKCTEHSGNITSIATVYGNSGEQLICCGEGFQPTDTHNLGLIHNSSKYFSLCLSVVNATYEDNRKNMQNSKKKKKGGGGSK